MKFIPLTYVTGVLPHTGPLITEIFDKKPELRMGRIVYLGGKVYETIVASRRPVQGVRTRRGWRWAGGSYNDVLSAPLKQITGLDSFPILNSEDRPASP